MYLVYKHKHTHTHTHIKTPHIYIYTQIYITTYVAQLAKAYTKAVRRGLELRPDIKIIIRDDNI